MHFLELEARSTKREYRRFFHHNAFSQFSTTPSPRQPLRLGELQLPIAVELQWHILHALPPLRGVVIAPHRAIIAMTEIMVATVTATERETATQDLATRPQEMPTDRHHILGAMTTLFDRQLR